MRPKLSRHWIYLALGLYTPYADSWHHIARVQCEGRHVDRHSLDSPQFALMLS
jgi:hypothetical protein